MEELRAALEAFQGLGEDAKEAFIWWVAYRSLAPILTFVGFCLALILGIRFARWMAELFQLQNQFLGAMAQRIDSCLPLSLSEKKQLMRLVDRGLRAEESDGG